MRLIAFFLPQYHPIPENDLWWGKGFTEWTNVTRARPQFAGHYQPQLPADLGFYDLRLAEVREGQAALARAHGIHGFCYHHYWFGGKRLLHRPLDEVVASGQPDFPFCVCWANENWTRRWDGAESDVLLAQRHSDADSLSFIRSLLPLFGDRRYIRVDGRPLLVVYRAAILPNAVRMTALWRRECRARGEAEPYLVAALTHGFADDPRSLGFDAAVEFPPHGVFAVPRTHAVRRLNPLFSGTLLDYRAMVAELLTRPQSEFPLFRTAVPSWDNTARRRNTATVFVGSSPEAYRLWLSALVAQARATRRPDEQIVFINAWNEWAEGCHLEPDRRYGHAWLEATRSALTDDEGTVRALVGALQAIASES